MTGGLQRPLLVSHGDADRLTSPSGSKPLFDRATSRDKELKWWPALYHEIFNEAEQREVFAHTTAWLEARV